MAIQNFHAKTSIADNAQLDEHEPSSLISFLHSGHWSLASKYSGTSVINSIFSSFLTGLNSSLNKFLISSSDQFLNGFFDGSYTLKGACFFN